MLKNKAVVDDAEKILKEFKPVTYDVSAQIKAIDSFEAKAVSHFVKLYKKPLCIHFSFHRSQRHRLLSKR